VCHEDQDIIFVERRKEMTDGLPTKYDSGKPMYKWLKDGTDPTYAEPTQVPDTASQSEKSKYQSDLKRVGDKNDKLEKDKSAFCSEILDNCSEELIGLLEDMENPTLDSLIADGDAKSLLECIGGFILGTKDNGTVPKHWMRMKLWKKLGECQMKQGRSIDQHYRVFMARVDALETAFGKLRALQDSRMQAADQDVEAGKMKAMFFLDSLGGQYKDIVERLHRTFAIEGKDTFPKTPAAALRVVKYEYRQVASPQADFLHVEETQESDGSFSDGS
jgi:3-methyladenine DNA glycosylase AlkC